MSATIPTLVGWQAALISMAILAAVAVVIFIILWKLEK